MDLLGKIPTQAYSNINVAEQFLTFNKEHPFVDQTHIVDRNLRRMHDQRYGLNLSDGLYAIYRLLKRGPAPPDVYQGQYDLKGVWAATKVFLGLTKT